MKKLKGTALLLCAVVDGHHVGCAPRPTLPQMHWRGLMQQEQLSQMRIALIVEHER